MPYNFETTFTQPLLNELDNGLVGGAEDWAKLITKTYVKTIKSGLPQNVTPIIPAPGLSGAPFTIGASGFTTTQSREQTFYTIVRAYYLAKELSMDKAIIDGLINTIRQLIIKIKSKQQQIKSIVEQIKLIKEELKQLPPLLKEIGVAIRDVIKEQTFNITNLENIFNTTKQQIGPEQFQRVFANELQLIKLLKSFDATNINGALEIAQLIGKYTEKTADALIDPENKELKKYIQSKLVTIAKEFLTMANGLIDPQVFINYLRQLAPIRPKIKAVYDKVQRFISIKKLLNPTLRNLEIKKRALIRELQLNLQSKLIKLREKVQKEIKERSEKRKKTKSETLFKKAKVKIDKFKKDNEKKIKRLQKKIKLYNQALKSITAIKTSYNDLYKEIPIEFEKIKEQIKKQVKDAQASTENIRNLATDLGANAEQVATPETTGLSRQLDKLKAYMNNIGLTQFANQAALIVIETKCNFESFKNLFEMPTDVSARYIAKIENTNKEIEKLIKTIENIQKLNEEARQEKIPIGPQAEPSPMQGPLPGLGGGPLPKPKSLKNLIKKITTSLLQKITKIQTYLIKKIKELKSYLKTKVEKFKSNLESFALSLIPLKSDIEDKNDKKLIIEAKKKELEEKKKQMLKIVEQTKYIYNMAVGSKDLLLSVDKGSYKLSENQSYIDKIVDNYFNYQKIDQPKPMQKMLDKDKKLFKENFETLKLIEVLIYGIIETIKDIKQTDFKTEIKNIIENAKENTPGTQTLKLIQGLIDNPPKTPIEVRDLANSLGGVILQDISFANTILNLERRYLQKSRKIIETMCDINQLENTKVKTKLTNIKNNLDKNQSFLLIAFKFLKEQLTIFAKFVTKKVKAAAKKILDKLKEKKEKKQKQATENAKKKAKNRINPEAIAISVMLDLAARSFWTGATWVGNTGSTHTTLNIGIFKKIKGRTEDGASGLIREIAKSFEGQLNQMVGLITPPPNTAIPPIPFSGYK